jgi:hypothetical protein
MVDGPEVKLGADAGPLKSGMDDASRSVAASLAGIQKALEGFTTASKKASDDSQKNNADISRAFQAMQSQVTGAFSGITGAIEKFKLAFGALSAVLAGGMLWKSSVEEMLHFEDEVRKIQIVFGMMSDQATTTATALKILGKTGDDFAAMGMKLARQIKQDETGLNDLGVATRNASGELLPLDRIMTNAFETMQTYRAGADQDVVALKAFGRGVGDVVEVMLRLPAAQQRAIELQHELGIEMGPEHQKEIEAYRLEVGAFQVVLASIGEKIGAAVLPQLMNLAKYFNDVGPAAVEFIIKAIKLLIATIDALSTGAKEMGLYFVGTWENLKIVALAGWEALKDIYNTGGANVFNIWAEMNRKKLKNELETNAAILGLEHDLVLRLAALDETHTGGAAGGVPGLRSGSRSVPVSGGPKAESDVAGFESSLKASENYYNNLKLQQGSFETWSVEMTRDYWAEVLAFANLSTKDRESITNKFYDAERQVQQRAFASYLGSLEAEKAALGHNIEAKIAIEEKETALIAQRYGAEAPEAQAAYAKLAALRQQLADQRNRIAEVERKTQEDTLKHEYDMAKLNADQALALRQISAQQRFAIEQKYLADEYQLELSAINDRIALMASDPTSDPVKLAELEEQKLKIIQDYETKRTQIENAAVLERKQYQLQADEAIQNSFGTLLSDLMSGTKSWKQAMLDAVNSITKALNDLVAKKLAQQLFGGGTAGGGIIDSLMSGLFGGGGGGGVTPGGFGLGGFDIPAFALGTNYVPRDTLAVVHKGEAIVPAAYNKGGRSLNVTNNFSVSGPVNTQTQDQIAAKSARATQRAMYRNL